jgi:hypothetical protein
VTHGEWNARRGTLRAKLALEGVSGGVDSLVAWAAAPRIDGVEVSISLETELNVFLEMWQDDFKEAESWADREVTSRIALERYLAAGRRAGDDVHAAAWTSMLAGQDPERPAFVAFRVPRMVSLGQRNLGRAGAF